MLYFRAWNKYVFPHTSGYFAPADCQVTDKEVLWEVLCLLSSIQDILSYQMHKQIFW